MKNLAFALAFVSITAFGLLGSPAYSGETKKVCNTQKDAKGKEVKVCKDVKMHKKLDGVKVPEKK